MQNLLLLLTMSMKSIILHVCSSVSSTLSGSAANCWDDILKIKLSEISEQRKTFINRLLGAFTDKVLSRKNDRTCFRINLTTAGLYL